MVSSKTGDETAIEASYRVSYRTELESEASTFADTLITPRAVEMATCVLGEQSKNKEETVLCLIVLLNFASRFVSKYSKTIGVAT